MEEETEREAAVMAAVDAALDAAVILAVEMEAEAEREAAVESAVDAALGTTVEDAVEGAVVWMAAEREMAAVAEVLKSAAGSKLAGSPGSRAARSPGSPVVRSLGSRVLASTPAAGLAVATGDSLVGSHTAPADSVALATAPPVAMSSGSPTSREEHSDAAAAGGAATGGAAAGVVRVSFTEHTLSDGIWLYSMVIRWRGTERTRLMRYSELESFHRSLDAADAPAFPPKHALRMCKQDEVFAAARRRALGEYFLALIGSARPRAIQRLLDFFDLR
jgi:hypothetical protein